LKDSIPTSRDGIFLLARVKKNKNVRIITAYRPDKEKWEIDFKTRRKK